MSYQRVIIVFHFMILSIRITEKSKQTRRQQRSERQQSWKPMNDRNAEKTKPAACFLQADLT